MPDPSLCIAPMMAWTDRHCRVFHRLLTRRTLLYTEMVTTGALLHGDVAAHLDFDSVEHPVALQLGGSEPEDLASCARLGERWGYDEINLNCGCPSERVQRGAFGACLMAEPTLVRDCVRAMVEACAVPVTVKHRIGIDRVESYAFVRDFVGTVAQGGARTFIVHARNAWLQGLSPKKNREIPPLRYELAYRLKTDFPELSIIVNGGITTLDQVIAHRQHVDGVMIGREAYQNPWILAQADRRVFARPGEGAETDSTHVEPPDRWQVAAQLSDYARQVVARGEPIRHLTRHVLGLFNGLPGARRWRQMLSDPRELASNDAALIERAAALVRRPDVDVDGRWAA